MSESLGVINQKVGALSLVSHLMANTYTLRWGILGKFTMLTSSYPCQAISLIQIVATGAIAASKNAILVKPHSSPKII